MKMHMGCIGGRFREAARKGEPSIGREKHAEKGAPTTDGDSRRHSNRTGRNGIERVLNTLENELVFRLIRQLIDKIESIKFSGE